MEKRTSSNCEIKIGQYVIIQRQNYYKLHLISDKHTTVFLGRDKIELSSILGTSSGTSFKMIPKKGSNREFTLNVCSLGEHISSDTLLKDMSSGIDNRNILDDGSSQMLSSDSILELRDSGISPQKIIGQLIENSKTFCNKTEYSQVKYLKKKDKKYFEYITIHNPTLRMIAEICYNRDGPNLGLRIDTLSQITTATNFQPDGTYILFENGYHGVVAATCLNSLADGGQLILVTPGSQGQKQAILAMNFNDLQLSRLLTVRASTLMQHLGKVNTNNENPSNSNALLNSTPLSIIQCDESSPTQEVNDIELPNSEDLKVLKNDNIEDLGNDVRKRKYSNDSSNIDTSNTKKKPRWAEEAEKASDILISKKVDGLIIVCKEFPSNILDTFLSYLAPSRPFVVYSLYQEPLVQLYIQLKKRKDIINLCIMETWLRSYQVLPERTHPAVNMSSTSGFLLSGLFVEP